MLKKIKLNPPLNITYVIDGAGLDKLSGYISRKRTAKNFVIGWDKETPPVKDYFWRKDRLWQIGDKNEQYVVDLLAFVDGNADRLYDSQGNYGKKIDSGLKPVIEVFKPVLCTNEFLKVGVHLGFEYTQSYWPWGMRPWNFFDCSVVERVIQAGYHTLKDYDYYGMEQMMARYFGVQIDKELQMSFTLDGVLTPEQIEYAALDTRYPLNLRERQQVILKEAKLEEVAQIENNAIGAFYDMHVHGQRINKTKWKERVDRKVAELQDAIAEMDKHFIPLVGNKNDIVSEAEVEKLKAEWKAKLVVTDEELRLRKEMKKELDPVRKEHLLHNINALEHNRLQEKEKLKAYCSERSKLRTKQKNIECEGQALINYQSPKLLDVLRTVKGLEDLKSTEDGDLDPYKKMPIIQALRNYRALSKQVKTYGYSFTNEWTTGPCKEEGWLHPGDGRLHPEFNQLDAETGRSTSSKPNGQNLPQDPTLRSCFEADPPDDEEPDGYVIVTADMAGAELRILTELSLEPVWLEAFDKDEDLHEICAERMYPDDWPKWAAPGCKYYAPRPDGTPLHEKCKCPIHKEKRDDAKVPNFLIPYGGEATNLAAQTGKTQKEAQEILDSHKKSFPILWDYLEKSAKEARIMEESRDMFGRRRGFPKPTYERAKEELISTAKSEEDSYWERLMRKPPYMLERDLGISFDADNWERIKAQVIEWFRSKNDRKPKKDELYTLLHVENPTQKNINSMVRSLNNRIERQGKNHRIQGTNATIAKLAMGCGYDSKEGKPFLWHTLPQYKAKQLAFVHDELIIQCPKRFGEAVADLIGDAFRRAAAEKMTKVIMKFDYHVAPYWTKG